MPPRFRATKGFSNYPRLRFDKALVGREVIDPGETLLILVARGSSHSDAIADMHRFTDLRAGRSGVTAKCCFAAVAQPTLDEMFDSAARSSYRRVVVQPHLLFVGQVLDQIYAAVEQAKATRSIGPRMDCDTASRTI